MAQTLLDLGDIQGDLLIGLQKNAEGFIFFKISDTPSFKWLLKQHVIRRITTAWEAQHREFVNRQHNAPGERSASAFQGVNLGLTRDGLSQLIGVARPRLDPSFERGADDPATTARLHDPPRSAWLKEFVSDRIDEIFLVTGPNKLLVTSAGNEMLRLFGSSIKVVYSEIGNTRPGAQRGFEHFGYRDGISQPGIRGLTQRSNPATRPDQGLPGQDLIWAGEFVFGYPGQDPKDPVKAGPPAPMAAPWLRNGSYMVFRRLEQKVPEFRRFVAERAARLGMDAELLGARMFGRWKDGAPWSWRRYMTIRPSVATTGATMILITATTRSNANVHTRLISARCTRATTRPAARRRPKPIASYARGFRLVPRWQPVKPRRPTAGD